MKKTKAESDLRRKFDVGYYAVWMTLAVPFRDSLIAIPRVIMVHRIKIRMASEDDGCAFEFKTLFARKWCTRTFATSIFTVYLA